MDEKKFFEWNNFINQGITARSASRIAKELKLAREKSETFFPPSSGERGADLLGGSLDSANPFNGNKWESERRANEVKTRFQNKLMHKSMLENPIYSAAYKKTLKEFYLNKDGIDSHDMAVKTATEAVRVATEALRDADVALQKAAEQASIESRKRRAVELNASVKDGQLRSAFELTLMKLGLKGGSKSSDG